ncbi:sodium-coupled monocarboxylate transporter 1-like [Rhineura floridana]|uniref:sodium-coupled monocarboxylate transporter 1-like n=1 Tax=Rhineura floridana TaxID=261503 RepID=UPI002AC80AEE|nr:sodium-coupled monocarboxylate transporter 1-like [Rhineura floridana]
MSTTASLPHFTPEEISDRFSDLDLLVFTAMLLLSLFIGIFVAIKQVHQTHIDYLMAGRSLTSWPVAFSLTATFMSAVTVLEAPAEIYLFGHCFGLFAFAYTLMVVISAEVFLPIYYRLEITSTYEYLQLRFNKYMRLLGTVIFMMLTILYTGIVIYSPSLALNQVTGIQLWGSVVSTGVVCIFYCALGGLKAIIWTEVLQFTLMISAFMAVIIRAAVIKGGFGLIIDDAKHGGRLITWEFNPNPLQRHTTWTVIIGGTFTWLSIFGTNQCQVQRYLACKSQSQAKKSLYINLFGLYLTLGCAVMCGLSMYSVYKDCDPWTAGFVSAPDQLMPYFMLEILGDFPGLPGLFVAGTFSGTLSTVSSSINALAVVTVEDLIKPNFIVSETNLLWISVGMKVLYGAVCLSMAAVASIMSGLLQSSLSIFGIFGGPLLGIFCLGILLPFANAKGAFSGLLCGFLIVLWLGVGAQKHPPPPHRTRPLPLSTEGCPKPNSSVITQLTTTLPPPTSPRPLIEEYWWYSLSYLYFSPLGTMITFIVGSIMSVVTGGLKQNVERRLLFGKEEFMANFLHWKPKCESKQSTNLPELRAARLALQHFVPLLIHLKHVLLRTDNNCVKEFINCRGGTKSLVLHLEASRLISWAEHGLQSLTAEYIKGVDNVEADWLSRQEVLPGEWQLHKDLFKQIRKRFGRMDVELFASDVNHQLKRVAAVCPDPKQKSKVLKLPSLLLKVIKSEFDVPLQCNKLMPTTNRYYVLEQSLVAQLKLPLINAPVVELVTHSLHPNDSDAQLKDSVECKMDLGLRQVHNASAVSVWAAASVSVFMRASLLWLQDLLDGLQEDPARVRSPTLKISHAVAFIADTSIDAGQFSAWSLVASVFIWRTLGLCHWEVDAMACSSLASESYEGVKLFGDLASVDILIESKASFLPSTTK